MVGVAAWLGVSFVHCRPSLLDLQEQWVGATAALKERQVHPHTDAAYPHDLADGIDLGEPVEQNPAVLLKGQPVLGQEVIDQVGLLLITDRDAEWRIGGYP